jgi:hypothetical protein
MYIHISHSPRILNIDTNWKLFMLKERNVSRMAVFWNSGTSQTWQGTTINQSNVIVFTKHLDSQATIKNGKHSWHHQFRALWRTGTGTVKSSLSPDNSDNCEEQEHFISWPQLTTFIVASVLTTEENKDSWCFGVSSLY